MRLAIAVLAFAFVAANAADTETEKPKYGDLKDAPGAALVFGFCSSCHSEKIIAQQGLSRADWDELLDWMTEEHGMAIPPPQLRAQMLDYLAAHYGILRENFPVPNPAK